MPPRPGPVPRLAASLRVVSRTASFYRIVASFR